MPVSDQKSSKFLEAINKYAQEQRMKIEDEVAQFKKQELDKAEMESLKSAYQLIQHEMAEMRLAISTELSHKETESRRKLFAKREQIMEEVFTQAAKKIEAFVQTDQYLPLLQKYAANLAGVLTAPDTVLYLRPADMQYAQQVSSAFGAPCSIKEDTGIRLGGIRGANESMGLVADETLDSKLAQQKEWFLSHSGLSVE